MQRVIISARILQCMSTDLSGSISQMANIAMHKDVLLESRSSYLW